MQPSKAISKIARIAAHARLGCSVAMEDLDRATIEAHAMIRR
jgi:hypothetical protein